MSSHNSKYYKKSLKRNKVVSHTLEKSIKRKRDDYNDTDFQPEKTAVTEPANSQLEEITQPANAENGKLVGAVPEEASSTAQSVSLSQSLEQNAFLFLPTRQQDVVATS